LVANQHIADDDDLQEDVDLLKMGWDGDAEYDSE
jgi:hypothetical protein